MHKKKFIHGTRHTKMRELLHARQATRIAVVDSMPNGTGSILEFWRVGRRVVIIQFWSGEGVDIYSQAGVGHTWEEVELFLNQMDEPELVVVPRADKFRLMKMERALRQFTECNLNEDNCASFEVANNRIRARATEALQP